MEAESGTITSLSFIKHICVFERANVIKCYADEMKEEEESFKNNLNKLGKLSRPEMTSIKPICRCEMTGI